MGVKANPMESTTANGESAGLVELHHRIRSLSADAGAWIALPEAFDRRILRAAQLYVEQYKGNVILLGHADELTREAEQIGWRLSSSRRVRLMDPRREAVGLREGSISEPQPEKLYNESRSSVGLSSLLEWGTLLVADGVADGMVAGAVATSATVLRSAIRHLRSESNTKWVCEGVLLVTRDARPVLFADCAAIPEPTSEQLAVIANEMALTFESLMQQSARVAMLSFSTKGSARGPGVGKVQKALSIIRERWPNMAADGEMQFDTAYSPRVARVKAPESSVAGKANVFIFPNLDSANIGCKIAQFLGGAEVLCLVPRGLTRPVVDLSRGASVREIVTSLSVCAALSKEDQLSYLAK